MLLAADQACTILARPELFLANNSYVEEGEYASISFGAKSMRKFIFVVLATLALIACGVPSASDFVQKAATSDMYEIEAGKIAAEKGQSDGVKQFGQHMVDAHSKTTEKLKGIVQAEKVKVDLPPALDSSHQKLIDELNQASGADFDKTYAKQQVDAHQEAVKLFKRYSEKGENKALKDFAAKTLPTIEQHLEQARKLPTGAERTS
jgi:putative membrane protein